MLRQGGISLGRPSGGPPSHNSQQPARFASLLLPPSGQRPRGVASWVDSEFYPAAGLHPATGSLGAAPRRAHPGMRPISRRRQGRITSSKLACNLGLRPASAGSESTWRVEAIDAGIVHCNRIGGGNYRAPAYALAASDVNFSMSAFNISICSSTSRFRKSSPL